KDSDLRRPISPSGVRDVQGLLRVLQSHYPNTEFCDCTSRIANEIFFARRLFFRADFWTQSGSLARMWKCCRVRKVSTSSSVGRLMIVTAPSGQVPRMRAPCVA